METDAASSRLVTPAVQQRLGPLARFADIFVNACAVVGLALRDWLQRASPAFITRARLDERVAVDPPREPVRDIGADELADLLGPRELMIDLAHELRTPMATIRASAEVLADMLAAGSADNALKIVENLEREAERLASLVDNLLDLNKIRAGTRQMRRVRCDLRDVVQNAVNAITPLADRRHQTFAVILPPEPVWVAVDRDLIERALLNILSNAQKFGAERGRVKVWLQREAREAAVLVEDDGPGIAEQDHERIFERLYRASAPEARRVQGSGLGLPIARAAVELHGGTIGVAAAPGGGSLFTMSVPLESVTPRPHGGADENPPDR